MKTRRFSLGRFLPWLGLAISLFGALTYFLQHTVIMSRLDTRQPGLYIILVGIAVTALGTTLEVRVDGVFWHKSLGVRILPISLALTALYVGYTYFAFRQEEVQFTNGNVTLVGTLLIPNSEGPHPAFVMMHGSGQATRMGMFAEAQSLARQGIAVLIYDKRGSGASVGGHYRFDGYEALASDGVASVSFLKSRNDIDSDQIGLWGTSEGGWTAPIAASKIDDLAFLIVVSGGPLTPEEQGAYSLENRLKHRGFSDEVVDQALELYAQINAYIRTGLGRNEVITALQHAQSSDWAEEFPLTIPPHSELSDRQRWWRDHMDTDVEPLLEKMDFPILYVLGANDPLIPSERVKTDVESILADVSHEDFAVKIFPEATHNLISSPSGCRLCLPDEGIGPILPWFAPGYLFTVSDWVTRRIEP